MKKVIITAAQPERLKVVGFLLQLAGWNVKVHEELADAVDYLKNSDKNEIFYDLFIVVDYLALGVDKPERLAGARYLDVLNTLKSPVPLVVASLGVEENEKQQMVCQYGSEIDFCSTESLVAYVETSYC